MKKNSRRATVPKRKTASPRRKPRVPIPIRAVDFVMYCTRDMRRTRAFYQRLFGFRPGEEWNDSWSEFKTLPVTLCLDAPSQKPIPNWHGTPAIALAVRDIHAAVRECHRRKVPVLVEPVETRVCWMALIRDPAGNRICLHQRKDGTAG